IRVWGTSSRSKAPTTSPASEYPPSPCASCPTRKQTGLRPERETVRPWTRRPSRWDSATGAASCSGRQRPLQPLRDPSWAPAADAF
ncbi:unnamed protein product, partial [Ixodes pacificus]